MPPPTQFLIDACSGGLEGNASNSPIALWSCLGDQLQDLAFARNRDRDDVVAGRTYSAGKRQGTRRKPILRRAMNPATTTPHSISIHSAAQVVRRER